jgi:hypothetical protein
MRIRNFSHLFYGSLVLALFAITSCQKEINIDLENPPPVPPEIQDSTLLIKSITLVWDVGSPDEDSVIEYYSYDTVNKKIILTWNDPSGEFPAGSSAELNYNGKGLLSHIAYKYSNGYTPDDEDKSAVDLIYDADNVLQKITVKLYGGKSETTLFQKTILPANKYQLDWTEPLAFFSSNDSARLQAIFDIDGKCIRRSLIYSYATILDNDGNPVSYTQIRNTDSSIFDANGSISKVITNSIDTFRHTNETIVSGEFISRESKGDQLYNQQQALLNGIANIPFLGDESGSLRTLAGILSSFSGDWEPLEYSKFPFQTARIYNWDTKQYDSFTAVSEFDNRSRLIKFKGFFADSYLIPMEYKISYYK